MTVDCIFEILISSDFLHNIFFMMTMNRDPRLSFSQLLAEVDMLERELKDLSREAQRGGDFIQQLHEIVARDVKHVEEIEKDTARVNQEILELESREKFLTEAVNSGTKSAQLLVQMETQARNTLEGEKMITNQLKGELKCKLSAFAMEVENEEAKYRKIPEYMEILKIEERVRYKSDMVAKLEMEKSQAMGLREQAVKEVAEDRQAWGGFKSSCLTLAEQWLKMKKLSMEVEALKKERGDVEMQVSSLLAERKAAGGEVSSSQTNVGKDCQYQDQEEKRNETGIPSVSQPDKRQLRLTSSSNVSSTLPSIRPPPPSQKESVLDSSRNPRSNAPLSSLPLADKPSTSALSSLSPPDMFKPPSTASSYVPPTPRTKQLHLKLGTSLLSKRKAGSVSTTAPPNSHGYDSSQMVSHSSPGSPPVIGVEKNSSDASSVKVPDLVQPVKKKSFKLGLPSLFCKKKPSSVIEGSTSKDIKMTRTPTLPHKEKEVALDIVTKDVVENMDVEESMDEAISKSISKDSSIIPSTAHCEMPPPEYTVPDKPALSSVLATHTTVEEIVQQDCPPSKVTMPMPKIPAGSKMLASKFVSTLPITTPRMSTKTVEISPTPSPQEKRQALCVSPGTALCDQKRKAVLEQLLESPQTVTKAMGNTKHETEAEIGKKDMQQSPAAAQIDKERFDSYGLQEGVGHGTSTFDFNEKNEDGDFVMGEGVSKDMFGDMGNSFSFFGGGDSNDKEGDGQAKDDNFAFSFGGIEEQEGNGEEGGEGFAFSFGGGGGFEDQNGAGGFSLF